MLQQAWSGPRDGLQHKAMLCPQPYLFPTRKCMQSGNSKKRAFSPATHILLKTVSPMQCQWKWGIREGVSWGGMLSQTVSCALTFSKVTTTNNSNHLVTQFPIGFDQNPYLIYMLWYTSGSQMVCWVILVCREASPSVPWDFVTTVHYYRNMTLYKKVMN